MEWTPEYSVGESTLDDDHKSIIDLINRFDYVFSVEVKDGLMESVLDALIDYTKHHFEREEQYMRMIGYPGLKEHQASHKALEEELDDLYELFHSGNTGIATEISEFLGKWLREHILETDMAYRAFAEQKAS